MLHNENSRVKTPALVHFTRLGYEYLSLKDYTDKDLIDEDTNIFIDLLCAAINIINGIEYPLADTQKLVNELKLVLDDDNEVIPLEGAFYAASSYKKLFFSHFREEDSKLISFVSEAEEDKESFILKANNLVSIKHNPEYITNRAIDTPTNSIKTLLFSFERLLTF